MSERKIQDRLERFGLSHTMGCITQASLGKSEWSLIAVQFEERSLNKDLLRADLTNQIVGVLARFQQNNIAFMADRVYVISGDGS